jgi:hypothetical protein
MLIFVEGGKPEDPEKNPHGKGENQQTTHGQTIFTCVDAGVTGPSYMVTLYAYFMTTGNQEQYFPTNTNIDEVKTKYVFWKTNVSTYNVFCIF